MDIGLVSRVGLQLLLEPSNTAHIFRGASVAAGAVYPAYQTYKAVVNPKRAAAAGRPAAANSTEAERWLKYWAVFGVTYLAERLLEGQLERFPYYPHLKFGFLLWLQLHHGHGACLLFDGYITPHLSRYERKFDTLLDVGAQFTELLISTYAVPLKHLKTSLAAALGQLAVFLKWITTPDDADQIFQQQQQQQQHNQEQQRQLQRQHSLLQEDAAAAQPIHQQRQQFGGTYIRQRPFGL